MALRTDNRTRLVALLDQARARLNQLRADIHALPPGSMEGHQISRDAFSDIHRSLGKVIAIIPSKFKGSTPDTDDPSHHRTHEYHEFVNNFSLLVNEQKRYHFTRAAEENIRLYAIAKNLSKRLTNAGVALDRVGSDQVTTQEVSFGFQVLKHFGVTAGPGGLLKLQQAIIERPDLDGDGLLTRMFTANAQAGLTFKIGTGRDDFNNVQDVFNASVNASVQVGFGSYNASGNATSAAAAKLLRSGKRWTYLARSGDKNSLAARFRQAENRIAAVASWVFGPVRTPYIPKPNVGAKKLLKGAFNQGTIHELTQRVFGPQQSVRDGTTPPVAVLASNAYQATPLKRDDFETYSAAEAPTLAARNPLAEMQPLPNPCGRNQMGIFPAIMRLGAGLDGALELKNYSARDGDKVNAPVRVGVAASFEFNYNNTKFCRAKGAHELLDIGYNNKLSMFTDFVESVKPKVRANGRLCLNETMSRARNQLDVLDMGTIPAATVTLLTQPGAAPDALKAAAHAVSKKTLDDFRKTQASIDELTNLYGDFMALASTMHSMKDKRYAKSMPTDVREKHNKDVASFLEKIFGNHAESLSLRESLAKNPKQFMVECYDAISIATAGVGSQMAVDKKKAFDAFQAITPPGEQALPEELVYAREQVTNARTRMDGLFNYLHSTLTAVYLPIDREELHRKSIVVAHGESTITNTRISAEGGVGMILPLLQSIDGNSKDPLRLMGKDDLGSSGFGGLGASMSSAVAGLSVKFERAYRRVKQHPDFLRLGRYKNVSCEFKGIGAAAPMAALVGAGAGPSRLISKKTAFGKLKRHFWKRADQNKMGNVLPKNLGIGLQRLIHLATGEQSRGVKTSTLTRRVPKNKDFIYESTTQCHRILITNEHRNLIRGSIPVDLFGGASAIAGVGHSTVGNDVAYEVLGDCPSHHIVTFPQFAKLLTNKVCGVDSATASKKPIDIRNLQTTDDLDRMRAYLTNEGAAGDENSDYFLHKYFSDPNSIMSVLEKFLAYDGRESADGKVGNLRPPLGEYAPLNGTLRNEFHRFDDNPHVRQLMQEKGNGLKFGTHPDAHLAQGESWYDMPRDPRPSLTNEERAAIIAILKDPSEYFGEPETFTAESVMERFLNIDRKSPATRLAFNAYCKICGAYTEITADAKSRIGYEPKVARRARIRH